MGFLGIVYLPPIQLVDEVGHGEENKERNKAARKDDILSSSNVFHHDPFLRDEQSALVMCALRVHLRASFRALVLLQPSPEVVVREFVEEAVEDKLLTRDDAKHVHKLLRFVTDEAAEDAAVDVGREDGEVDIRVGVRGVEEAEESDRVGRPPELENPVRVQQVCVKRPVLVPALARSARLQNFQ